MDDSIDSLRPPRAAELSAPDTPGSSRAPSVRRQETRDSEKAGRVWARHAEEDAWAPCILTLDGGGIRGYSSLLILKALMHEVWLWELRLEEEEREARGNGGTETGAGGEGTDGGQQATAGAASSSPRINTEVHERSPLTHELRNSPEEMEARHGVSTDVPVPDSVDPAVRHVERDSLTSGLSSRKAINEEELLPCHYFDFMYGTSTGGLIATILGRLRMTVTEALELYRKVGEDLFGKRRSHIPLTTKYHHEPLERAVRDIVGSRCHEHPSCDGTDLFPWESSRLPELLARPVPFDVSHPRLCQSCCLTAANDENISEAYLLRTYPHYYTERAPNWITRYNEGADALPIWQVTRATTAAPFYFDLLTTSLDNTRKSFQDGGIRENNPSGAALSEFHALYAGACDQPALMLSVGTGRPDQTQDGFATTWPGPFGRFAVVEKVLQKLAVVQNLLIKYTEGEKQHHQMREHARGEHTWYKRLNVSAGLERMGLDEWVRGEWGGEKGVSGGASLCKMEAATQAYLEREFEPSVDSYAPPKVMLRQAAEKLVRQRRAREEAGGERWSVFVGERLAHKKKDEGEGEASVAG